MKPSALPCLVAVVSVLAMPPSVDAESGSFHGGYSLGVRSVDTSGADRKFREDFHLEDGPRLFDLHFTYAPRPSESTLADRVSVALSNLGGDPFEAMRLELRKFGAYQLNFRRTTSDYFYEDLILPVALSDVSKSNAGDFHHFDFQRVRDTADLKIDLSRRAKVAFGFDRFTKRGESTTTLDVSRDEFELDRPIDESMNSYQGSFSYAWDSATLTLTERRREYENRVELFLPGASTGENPTGAFLDFYFLDQPYDTTSREHVATLGVRPSDRLDLRFLASIQDLDTRVRGAERSQGVAFNGAPLATDLTGSGTIARDLEHFRTEGTFRVSDRLAVVGAARRQTLDQRGGFQWGPVLNGGDWEIDTTGVEVGVQVAVSPRLSLSAGVVDESRDVVFETRETEDGEVSRHGESVSTDNTGVYGSLHWRPSKAGSITLDLESNSFDDPFTAVSPTDRSRYRLRGKYRWATGVTLSGGYTLTDYENGGSGWNADTGSLAVRLGFEGDRFDGSLGWSEISAERSIDQLVNENNLFSVFYESDATFVDGRVRVRATDRLALGADLRLYENDGSFTLSRDDFRGWVEIGFLESYEFRIGFRTVDYDEGAVDFDDYQADILEISVGQRW